MGNEKLKPGYISEHIRCTINNLFLPPQEMVLLGQKSGRKLH